MKVVLILVAAGLLLSGCITRVGRALVPQLKPADVGITFKTTCSDLAAKVLAAGAMETAQLIGLYSACEQMQAEQRVTIDPEGARKAILPLP